VGDTPDHQCPTRSRARASQHCLELT
jgi:hypothetical protein